MLLVQKMHPFYIEEKIASKMFKTFVMSQLKFEIHKRYSWGNKTDMMSWMSDVSRGWLQCRGSFKANEK